MEAGRHREVKTTMVWPRQNDARGENTKTNYGMDTTGEKEKRTPNENVDGRSTSSDDNKKFRTRSMEKQRGMAFGFRKTATAIKKIPVRQTDHFLAVYRVQLTNGELDGTFINQHNCLLIRSLAHLNRHPSSVNVELYAHSREDSSVWYTPECYELDCFH
jgi:hypothetical protein